MRLTCKRWARDNDAGFCRTHYTSHLRNRALGEGYAQGLVDAGPVTAHLHKLKEAGLSLKRMSAIGDIDEKQLGRLFHGRVPRCQGRTAKKLLDIPIPVSVHEVAATRGFVPALGTVRRIQGLIAMGYSCEAIAERLGSSNEQISLVSLHKKVNTTADFANRVADLFSELQMEVPPQSQGATKARRRAEKRGWRLPLMWDEDEIDNPNAGPAVPREVKRVSRRKQYDDLRCRGLNDTQIAKELGIHPSSLSQWLLRERKRQAK